MPSTWEFRRILLLTAGLVGGLIVIGYVLFQARFLLMGPRIYLTEVPHSLQNERKIELSGRALNITHLWLNDRPIYTDATGNFKEALVLENGYTIATLRAEDRYGRVTTVSEDFFYAPATFIQYN